MTDPCRLSWVTPQEGSAPRAKREHCRQMNRMFGKHQWRSQTFAMGGTPSGGPPNFSRAPPISIFSSDFATSF